MGVCFENEIKFPIKWGLEPIKISNPDFSRLIVIIYHSCLEKNKYSNEILYFKNVFFSVDCKSI